MTRLIACLLICLAPLAALADTPLSASEFDAYTRGKTLFFSQNGRVYGAEEYLQNRRVRWSFLDGECKDGRWYADGPEICFIYDDNPDPQCWEFRKGPGGLTAEFKSGAPMPHLYEAQDTGEEMICLGPKIGV